MICQFKQHTQIAFDQASALVLERVRKFSQTRHIVIKCMADESETAKSADVKGTRNELRNLDRQVVKVRVHRARSIDCHRE